MKKEGVLELCKTDKDAFDASSLMVEVLKEFVSLLSRKRIWKTAFSKLFKSSQREQLYRTLFRRFSHPKKSLSIL